MLFLQTASEASAHKVHEMDFKAARKPHITMCNAKRWMECCKAHPSWTLERWKRGLWSDKSCFAAV